MEPRDRDGGSHKVAIWVGEDVAKAGCNLSIFPKETELVAYLHHYPCKPSWAHE